MTGFSSQELQQFKRDGFIVVRQLAEVNLVSRMLQIASDELAKGNPPIEYEAELGYPGSPSALNALGGYTPRRLKQALCRSPDLFGWATHPSLIFRLQQLLAPPIVLSLAHHNCLMTSHPQFSSDTGWHQDMRYWSFERSDLVTTFLALTPFDSDHGRLKFLPGSHKIPIADSQLSPQAFLSDDCPENRQLLQSAISCELNVGDVVFFHSMTFHAANRNRSNRELRSILFTYRSANNLPIQGSRSASMPELIMPILKQGEIKDEVFGN